MQNNSTVTSHQNEVVYDPDELYRRTQSQIYRLQETLLNSSKSARVQRSDNDVTPVTTHRPPITTTAASLANNATTSLNISPSILPAPPSARELPIVDSTPVLRYTKSKYKDLPRLIGEITYHPTKTGIFKSYDNPGNNTTESSSVAAAVAITQPEPPYLSNFKLYDIPDPLLPNFTRDKINKLIKIKIPYRYIRDLLESRLERATHAQLWGTDIYTDDSDPLLALQHVGFFDRSDFYDLKKLTPANLSNFNDVIGNDDDDNDRQLTKRSGGGEVSKYDLEVTVLLLDTLSAYIGTDRFGICSRDWYGVAPHDGLSFGIYQIEVKPAVIDV